MKIAIVGIGLIGGSLSLDLKKRGFADKIIGVDNNQFNAHFALENNIIDKIYSLEDAIDETNLIILATPVDSICKLLPTILSRIKNQVVTDMGSIKGKIIDSVKNHPKRNRYVASHPMAGTEYSGPVAALNNLFDNKCAIICDKENSDTDALNIVVEMYRKLNMKIIEMDAKSHDVHTAFVSHISHISSFALALTVLDKEKDEKNILNLASGGFDSTVRLAKSSAEMWTLIFDYNSDNVLNVLDSYIEKLFLFRKHIKETNKAEVHNLITKANSISKILKTRNKNILACQQN